MVTTPLERYWHPELLCVNHGTRKGEVVVGRLPARRLVCCVSLVAD